MGEPVLVSRHKPCPDCGAMMTEQAIELFGHHRRMFVCPTETKNGKPACGNVEPCDA